MDRVHAECFFTARATNDVEVEMKGKIEAAANVMVIIFAVVVGSLFLKDRLFTVALESNAVKAGDKLANLDGWDWGAHDQTLVLVLRKGCHFCEDSVPFYQRLSTHQQQGGPNSNIVAVFPDTADTVKEVVQSEGLRIHALSGVPLERLKIDATPTLLLVDSSGTVLKAWIGMLSPREELDVLKAMTAPAASGLKSPG
jgi:thioredoxin-related protein